MSKTDATRPGWVQLYDNTLPSRVEHDHRYGQCIEETFEDARNFATQRRGSRWWNHRWNCGHYETIPDVCPHDPKKHSTIYGPCPTITRAYRDWSRWDDEQRQAGVWWLDRPRFRIPEHDHTRRVYRDDLPCECDDWPPAVTCERSFSRSYRWYAGKVYGGGVPTWYTSMTWHRPERRRERDELREAVKMANAGEDLSDYDFRNEQHRHRAGWNWW